MCITNYLPGEGISLLTINYGTLSLKHLMHREAQLLEISLGTLECNTPPLDGWV